MRQSTTGSPMPPPVKTARTILFIQGSLLLVFMLVLGYDAIIVRLEHGQDVEPLVYLGTIGNLLLSLAFLATAIWIRAGISVRRGAIAAESLSIVFGIFNVFSGFFLGIGGIVLGILVIVQLLRPEVEDWYEGEHIGV